MEKFDSISHFLQTGAFDYRVYDMGRKVAPIDNHTFAEIENQTTPYPYPFQQKAWLALLFWPAGKANEAVIWFLQFPIDELGFLQQAARDTFLIDLLEQTGKNIQAKQQGQATEDGLNESPFAFKPREDRLAMFHALATTVLAQPPSQHYQYARDYLQSTENGGAGYEQWQFLGVQGIADVVARLQQDDNTTRLAAAINKLPEVPLCSYLQALENIHIDDPLFNAIKTRINTELASKQPSPSVLAALLRGISAYPSNADKQALLMSVLNAQAPAEIEVIAAISGRSWQDLHHAPLRQCFVQQLAQHDQQAFNAIIADLLMLPDMRDLLLGEMRSENRSPELAKKFGTLMQAMAGH